MTDSSIAGDPSEPRRLPERIRISPDVLFQEIESEGVLMDTAKETYFSLDPMGTAIWKLLSADPSIETTRIALLGRYEVSAEELDKDLLAFISRLIDAGLVIAEP